MAVFALASVARGSGGHQHLEGVRSLLGVTLATIGQLVAAHQGQELFVAD